LSSGRWAANASDGAAPSKTSEVNVALVL
jgi:hypothetical protein